MRSFFLSFSLLFIFLLLSLWLLETQTQSSRFTLSPSQNAIAFLPPNIIDNLSLSFGMIGSLSLSELFFQNCWGRQFVLYGFVQWLRQPLKKVNSRNTFVATHSLEIGKNKSLVVDWGGNSGWPLGNTGRLERPRQSNRGEKSAGATLWCKCRDNWPR